MQKILNDPLAFVDEMLDGIMLAHPDQLRLIGSDHRGVVGPRGLVGGSVGGTRGRGRPPGGAGVHVGSPPCLP